MVTTFSVIVHATPGPQQFNDLIMWSLAVNAFVICLQMQFFQPPQTTIISTSQPPTCDHRIIIIIITIIINTTNTNSNNKKDYQSQQNTRYFHMVK